MTAPQYSYYPKGSMCGSCAHKLRDCSHLPFERMQVIETVNLCKFVKCTDYTSDKKSAR